MLGVASPSKVHVNLAAVLPILYSGLEKSNADEVLTNFDEASVPITATAEITPDSSANSLEFPPAKKPAP